MKREAISEKEFAPIVTEYVAYLGGIQGRSQHTIDQYLFDLRTFFRFLLAREDDIDFGDRKAMEQIDVKPITIEVLKRITFFDITAYVSYLLNDRGCGSTAIARQLSALRSFFKYLTKTAKYLPVNPMAEVETPKKKKSLPKVLTVEESKALLKSAETEKYQQNRVRDYAILTLFLNCGMRVSELAGINISDFDPDLTTVRVVGKGNKERILYLNQACRSAVADYMDERRSEPLKSLDTNAFFISQRKHYQRMSVKTIQEMVYKHLKSAGLEYKHYSVHKLRHTAATLMYQAGDVDIRILQEILGHEQLNTTQIYTHVVTKQIQDAMEKNPLSEEERKV